MAPSFFSSLLLLAATSIAAPVVNTRDASSFANSKVFDFSTGSTLPEGLSVSTDQIAAGGSPFSQHYTNQNVYVRDGVLNLKVPGGQSASPVMGAQVVTDEKILYGSIRTTAKVSSVGGTCSGFFSYNNANLEESDIEILTSNLTAIHYTNQNPHAAQGGPRSATQDGKIPEDAATAFHEYRTDWLPGKVQWYLDGVLQNEITQYTPTAATPWVWNNWSNGDKTWSAGPPTADNVLEIKKIEMHYNTN